MKLSSQPVLKQDDLVHCVNVQSLVNSQLFFYFTAVDKDDHKAAR